MLSKNRIGKISPVLVAVMLAQLVSLPVVANTTINSSSELSDAVKTAGDYTLGSSMNINQLAISASGVNIDGNGNTLTSANSSLKDASLSNKSDGISASFKNIILDGGNQQKTDTCIWLGRGDWVWENVTVQNWVSTAGDNRGAITLGKSSGDPGNLTMYSGTIKNNSIGLALDDAGAIGTIYGADITNNTNMDVSMYSGTLNLLDDDSATEKTIGNFVLNGGTVNISGNTSISSLVLNSGTVNITDDIISEEGITLNLNAYIDNTVVAYITDGVDGNEALNDIKLPAEVSDKCYLELNGSEIVLRADESLITYTTEVNVDYDVSEGASNRLASGVLHAVDYKTPAEYLSDGIYLYAVRGQAHQDEFDSTYEYLPGFFDDKTYERISEINPDNVLMMGLYYGFKPQYGDNWQSAALENNGETWKNYIKTFMQEAYDENGNKVKNVYSWIPWNEPELQWGSSNLSNFYKAFEYAYDAVKEFDARELVQGPEFASYNFSRMTSFLTYCRDNDCLPDVLSWHELQRYPLDIEGHTKELRDWMLANGIEPMPMAVTEYQGTGYRTDDDGRKSQGTYNPGLTVAYIATMERAEEYGFEYGLKSAWGRTGGDPLFTTDLGQMADFETGTMPTGLWYVYHEYKNMTGEKVNAAADTSVIDAVATYDSSVDRKSSAILIGNWEDGNEYISVTLKNIPESLVVDNKVSIKVESISETLATTLYGTDVLSDTEYEVVDGTATVNVILEGRAAAALTVTPPTNTEAKTELTLGNRTSTSNINISEEDGVVYATGGKTSTYTNENPVGNELSTSYKDNGDGVTFSVNVETDGVYKIDGTHVTGTDMGYMQLYVDGEAFSEPIDLYSTATAEKTINYGNLFLSAGNHEFTYQIVGFGKNESSTDTKLSFKSIAITPIKVSENECVVTYDLNADDAKATQTSSTVNSGDVIDFVPEAERDNYKFVAWNTQADGKGEIVTSDTVVNSDMTVYAIWEKDVRVEMMGDTEYAVLTRDGDNATITIDGANNKIVKIQANNKDVTDLLVTKNNSIVLENYDVSEETVFIIDVTVADDVKTTIIEGSRLSLPDTVIAIADDGSIGERNVTWDYSALTTTGKKHIDIINGTFDGGSVTAEVTVLPCSEELSDMVSTTQSATPHNLANKYTGKFTVEFDMSFEQFSSQSGVSCSFIAFINSDATNFGWEKYGPQIIVEVDGSLRARIGDGKGNRVSTTTASRKLELGEVYKIRMDIDTENDEFDAWVVYPDGVEEQFGKDAHFRTNLTDVGKVAVEDSDNINEFNVTNFKISTYTDAPIVEESPNYIKGSATGNQTTVDTANLVSGGNISGYLVTTAKAGELVSQKVLETAPTVIDTTNADMYEIAPVYTFDLSAKTLDELSAGVNLSDTFVSDNYDIEFVKSDDSMTDIYINDLIVGNDVGLTGEGRTVTEDDRVYKFNYYNLTNNSLTVKSDALLTKVTVSRTPSILEDKPTVFIAGGALSAKYYGTEGVKSQTGWGQELENIVDGNIVNFAGMDMTVEKVNTDIMSSIINNAQKGDLLIIGTDYADYDNNALVGIKEIYDAAIQKGMSVYVVSPNVSAENYNKSEYYSDSLYEAVKDCTEIVVIDLSSESWKFVSSTGITTKASDNGTLYKVVRNSDNTIKSIEMMSIEGGEYIPAYGSDDFYLWNDNQTPIKTTVATDKFAETYNMKDNATSSNTAAELWAVMIAKEMYNNGVSIINSDYEVSFTDSVGNDIIYSIK